MNSICALNIVYTYNVGDHAAETENETSKDKSRRLHR